MSELGFSRHQRIGMHKAGFFCDRAGLILEVEPLQPEPGRAETDRERDALLQAHGLLVMRLKAMNVLRQPSQVAKLIEACVAGRVLAKAS